MTRKLLFLVMVLVLALPATLFAAKSWVSIVKNTKFNETPVTAPMDNVFDACGPPDNAFFTANLKDMGMGPYKLFNDFYFIGTSSVGAFVLDTKVGLIVIDAGWGGDDCSMMMDQLKELGFETTDIKLILVSHEHIDHYGCIKEWKEYSCPNAKIAMSRIGWNYLRAWPDQNGFAEPRPESIDMVLKDEQIIRMGNKTVKVFDTPGHSPGCVSFVIPVMDRGERHVVGIMGGTAAPKTLPETLLYRSSVDYFKQVCEKEKCDIGLGVHASKWKDNFVALQTLGRNEANPLVIGAERFVAEYIQSFYDIADAALAVLPLQHFGRVPVEECQAVIDGATPQQ